MKWINCDPEFLMPLADIIGIVPSASAVCIAEFDGDKPLCGALFDGYNGQSIHGHIWIADGYQPTRNFWWAIYDYPFRQCQVTNLIGTVMSSNKKSQRLVEHLGFRLKAVISHYYPNDDDMWLYVCTVQTGFRWERITPARVKAKEQENGQGQKESAAAA